MEGFVVEGGRLRRPGGLRRVPLGGDDAWSRSVSYPMIWRALGGCCRLGAACANRATFRAGACTEPHGGPYRCLANDRDGDIRPPDTPEAPLRPGPSHAGSGGVGFNSPASVQQGPDGRQLAIAPREHVERGVPDLAARFPAEGRKCAPSRGAIWRIDSPAARPPATSSCPANDRERPLIPTATRTHATRLGHPPEAPPTLRPRLRGRRVRNSPACSAGPAADSPVRPGGCRDAPSTPQCCSPDSARREWRASPFARPAWWRAAGRASSSCTRRVATLSRSGAAHDHALALTDDGGAPRRGDEANRDPHRRALISGIKYVAVNVR
jgi:hypothetical protein